jgi:hypothetical protein
MHRSPDRRRTFSPQPYARAAGALYLVEIALAFAVNPVWSGLVGPSGVSVAAAQLVAPFSPWRLAFAGEILTYVCYAAVAGLLYALFRPVNRALSLLAAFFMLAHAAIGAASALGRLAAIRLLSGSADFSALPPHQLQAMASLALSMRNSGHDVALAFFAIHSAALGYLIYRSGYVPKILGLLFGLGSLCLSISIATAFLDPAINDAIFPAIIVPFFLAQLFFALWLTIFGVNLRKWPPVSDA